jgi:hypothetical protein
VTNDPFFRGEFGGRGLVPGKSRLGEFLHPERYADHGGLVPDDDPTSSGSRSLALKLVAMATVAIALLVAIIVIFT